MVKKKNISVSTKITDILKKSKLPMRLIEIREDLDGGYDSPYVMARLCNLRKRGIVGVEKVLIKTINGHREIQQYFIKGSHEQ